MSRTAPTRVPDDLFEEARAIAEVMSRSAAQQIAHWARVGREVEMAGGVSVEDIHATLAGRRSYDELSGEEQAIVRAQWGERMVALKADLDFAEEFAREGLSYVELDAAGKVVRRESAADPASGS
jgi:hypothetical protein